MGGKHSCKRCTCCQDFVRLDIRDGDKFRLWSVNSTTGPGKYVYPTNVPGGGGGYVVAATGDAEGTTEPETVITFEEEKPAPLMFKLKFEKNDASYYLVASKSGAVASASDSDTWFQVIELLLPNRPYIVLQSNKNDENGKPLYLSSDGAGNMKLKLWNAKFGPDENSPVVDPALLFRAVEPKI